MIQGARRKRARKGPIVIGLLLVATVLGAWRMYRNHSVQPDIVYADQHIEEPVHTVSAQTIIGDYDYAYTIEEGDVLSDVFAEREIPFSEIVGLEQAESDIFSFHQIHAGKTLYVKLNPSEADFRIADVYYQPDNVRVIHASQTSGGWVIEEEEIIYETREVEAGGSIDSSLYLTGLGNGLDDKTIITFADIFAWDIDFALQTRTGDEYRLIYEQKYLEGEFITSGKVLAAEYVNNGNSFMAFYFPVDDLPAYFDEEGNALQKAFLKAPVNYRYVTSGFSSARFHPIIGKVIPHNGVDYAAPYGSPIIAVADGIVSNRGWMGAYGNRIEVKHGDRYGSQYSHMSSFADLAIGETVQQGQVVGYVGSTGYSTGNHVHFSMTDRGTYVNPDQIDVPDGEPVPESLREDYLNFVDTMKQRLEVVSTQKNS